MPGLLDMPVECPCCGLPPVTPVRPPPHTHPAYRHTSTPGPHSSLTADAHRGDGLLKCWDGLQGGGGKRPRHHAHPHASVPLPTTLERRSRLQSERRLPISKPSSGGGARDGETASLCPPPHPQRTQRGAEAHCGCRERPRPSGRPYALRAGLCPAITHPAAAVTHPPTRPPQLTCPRPSLKTKGSSRCRVSSMRVLP